MSELKFNLENAIERSHLIEKSIELFGNNQKVLQHWSDGLIYVFDTVVDAITFAIYRVKEVDGVCETFESCSIGNVDSNHKYISIHIKESQSWCTTKLLSSFEYPDKKKHTNDTNEINQDEIDYILDGKGLFDEPDESIKSVLLTKELEKCLICGNNANDRAKIERILNRYYGNSWNSYWYSYTSDRKSKQLMFNIKTNSSIVRIPIRMYKDVAPTSYNYANS